MGRFSAARTPRFTRRRFVRNVSIAAGIVFSGLGARNFMTSTRRFPLSDHCDGRRFFNPRHHVNRNWLEVLKWKFTSKPAAWPDKIDLPPPPPLPPPPLDGTIAATWINHATVLLQTRHGTLLTDPIFSERTSPVSWAGPQRVHPPGVAWDHLPPVDVILLSHDHYDHCDMPTLRRFAAAPRPPLVITPLGNADLLHAAGFAASQIVELDWWEAHEINPGFFVRATPARHWSNRVSGSRNHRLWSGFFVHAGGRTAYYSGDTGYDDQMFKDVRAQCGQPDLGIIPIGAYEPRWFMAVQHCDPAEALRIHQEVGAQRSIGVHWGTFQLTDEAREAPVSGLENALRQASLAAETFRVLQPGESLHV